MLSNLVSWISGSHGGEGSPDGDAASHETARHTPTPTKDIHATPSHQPHEKSSMTGAVSSRHQYFGDSVHKLFNDRPDHPYEVGKQTECVPFARLRNGGANTLSRP